MGHMRTTDAPSIWLENAGYMYGGGHPDKSRNVDTTTLHIRIELWIPRYQII